MAEEYVFRKASVGGFNRADVIDYIEKQKTELNAEREKTAELEKTVEELRQQTEELTKKLADAEAAAKSQTERFEEEKKRLEADYASKAEKLASESPEAKIGKAIIDVRRYSDELLTETADKINAAADDTDRTVFSTLKAIDNVSADLKEFSSRINWTIDGLLADFKKLSADISEHTDGLKVDFAQIAKELNEGND